MINDITKQIDACFIKTLRKSNGDTADTLSSKIGINKTSLYYVENGVKNVSNELLNKITSYYHVNYNTDTNLYDQAYDLTIKLYESYLFKKIDLLNKYEQEFYDKEIIFELSRGFIFIKLIKAIINLLKNRSLTGLYAHESKEYLPLYDNNIAGIFAIVYACGKDSYLNLEDVKSVFVDIYEKCTNHNTRSSIKGMMHYQMGKIAGYDNDYLEGLRFHDKAIHEFQEIFCIERINQVEIEIAGIYVDLGLYDKAEQAYLRCLNVAYNYNFDFRIKACLNNLSWLYFIERKYDECIDYVNKAVAINSYYKDIYYFLAYCTYKTKTKAEARALITNLLSKDFDSTIYRMLKMIRGFVNDNFKEIDLYFERVKSVLLKHHNKTDLKALYEMNILYYKEKDETHYYQLLEGYFNFINNKEVSN